MKVNAVVLSLKSGTRAARAKLPVWFLVVTRRAATPSGRSLRSGRRRRQGSRPATARQGTAAGQALARLPAPPLPPRPPFAPFPPPRSGRAAGRRSPGHGRARLRARGRAGSRGPLPAGEGTLAPSCSRNALASPAARSPPGRLRGREKPNPVPGEAPDRALSPRPPAPSPPVPGAGLAGPGAPRLRLSGKRTWRRPPGTAPQRRLAVPRRRRPPLPVKVVR